MLSYFLYVLYVHPFLVWLRVCLGLLAYFYVFVFFLVLIFSSFLPSICCLQRKLHEEIAEQAAQEEAQRRLGESNGDSSTSH